MKVVLAELFIFPPFLPRLSLSFVVRTRYPVVLLMGEKTQVRYICYMCDNIEDGKWEVELQEPSNILSQIRVCIFLS